MSDQAILLNLAMAFLGIAFVLSARRGKKSTDDWHDHRPKRKP